jgi:hypothetical protein
MPLGERRLAAVFFIPLTVGERSIEQLGLAAGVADPFTVEWHPIPLHCRWAAMEDSCARLDVLEHHYCFQIYFWLSAFFELRQHRDDPDLPVEQDGAIEVAYAFRDACVRLPAEVGFIVSHLDQANPEYILDQYTDVLGMNADALASTHFGLLYLSEALVYSMNGIARLDGRETIPASSGRLVFSGKGANRWF